MGKILFIPAGAISQLMGKIAIFLFEFQSEANLIAIGACLLVGCSLLTERGRQKIIPNLLFIIIGLILIFGAINFGAAFGEDLAF